MKKIQAFPNQKIFDRVLNVHGVKGKDYDYENYNQLKFLYDLNKIFSNNPYGEIIDRTGNTNYPFQVHIRCPWIIPKKEISLETACENRVKEIIRLQPEHFFIYWSGGIDSTLMLITFLKIINYKNITVILGNKSISENSNFYEKFLKNKINILTIYDLIPTNYGIHITGDPADTVWAILDNDFMDGESAKYFYKSYKDYLYKKNSDESFLEKVEIFNTQSGREIKTLFEARWWFYINCKSQSKSTSIITRFNTSKNFCPFFESNDFDTWSFYNTDRMIVGNDWKTYKFPAKEIIYNFDKNLDYFRNKSKEYSNEPMILTGQKPINYRNIPLFITDNLERPTLSSGFFFSENIYRQELYETYKDIFMPT